jgi:hypothetical protein
VARLDARRHKGGCEGVARAAVHRGEQIAGAVGERLGRVLMTQPGEQLA